MCKVFRSDGPNRCTNPSRKSGNDGPFLFRGDWKPIGAVWTAEVDDFRSNLWEVERVQQPYPFTLFFALKSFRAERSGEISGETHVCKELGV